MDPNPERFATWIYLHLFIAKISRHTASKNEYLPNWSKKNTKSMYDDNEDKDYNFKKQFLSGWYVQNP